MPQPLCRAGLLAKAALTSATLLLALQVAAPAQITTAVEVVNESIIVDVDLGAGRSARLLLDSGAQTTTFSRAAAARLKLPTSRPQDENSIFAGTGAFEHVSIGSIQADKVPFGVLKLKNDVWDHIPSKRGSVDGSLGLDLLTRFAVGINMAGATVTFWKDGELTPESTRKWFDYLQVVPVVETGGAEAALKTAELPRGATSQVSGPDRLEIWLPPKASIIVGGRGYKNPVAESLTPLSLPISHRENNICTVRGELDALPFVFDLDTGSNRVTLPPGFTGIIRPTAQIPGAALNTVDTTELVTGCVYRSLKLGEFEQRFPYALAANGHSAYTRNPTLGMGLFTDCKLLLDFPGQRLSVARVSPNAEAPRNKLAELGIFLAEKDGRQRLYVGTGSPGARLGLRDGDALVRCEGLPPAQPDPSIVVKLVDEDQPISVTVRRPGSNEMMTFTFDQHTNLQWEGPAQVTMFPAMPSGYSGAKRFPNGGLYQDSNNVMKLVRPGGSVLVENGKFQVAYHDTRTKSFALSLPKSKFQIVLAQKEPGTPPVVAAGMGLLWVGGVGWVIGPEGSRIELDGFTATLKRGPNLIP